jgi:hypothetical protein
VFAAGAAQVEADVVAGIRWEIANAVLVGPGSRVSGSTISGGATALYAGAGSLAIHDLVDASDHWILQCEAGSAYGENDLGEGGDTGFVTGSGLSLGQNLCWQSGC